VSAVCLAAIYPDMAAVGIVVAVAVRAVVFADMAVGIAAAVAVRAVVFADMAVGIAAAAVARAAGMVAAVGCPPRIADKSPARLVTVPRIWSNLQRNFLCCIVRSFFSS